MTITYYLNKYEFRKERSTVSGVYDFGTNTIQGLKR